MEAERPTRDQGPSAVASKRDDGGWTREEAEGWKGLEGFYLIYKWTREASRSTEDS